MKFSKYLFDGFKGRVNLLKLDVAVPLRLVVLVNGDLGTDDGSKLDEIVVEVCVLPSRLQETLHIDLASRLAISFFLVSLDPLEFN